MGLYRTIRPDRIAECRGLRISKDQEYRLNYTGSIGQMGLIYRLKKTDCIIQDQQDIWDTVHDQEDRQK
jgi:hypothetical protein